MHPPKKYKCCSESKFNKYVSDIKHTWTTINELLNKCNSIKEFPSYFIISGDKIDNKEDIANNLNSFFQNIGPTLSVNIHQQKSITTKNILFNSANWNRKQYLKWIKLIQNTVVVVIIYQLYLSKIFALSYYHQSLLSIINHFLQEFSRTE